MKILIALALASAPLQAADSQGTISVKFDGLRSTQGNVLCNLFQDAAAFPIAAAMEVVTVAADAESPVCVFKDVANGVYAISIVHDENANDKLDTTAVGVPLEGVGSSNNVRPLRGPPVFEASKFTVEGGDVVLVVKLFY